MTATQKNIVQKVYDWMKPEVLEVEVEELVAAAVEQAAKSTANL